MKKNSFKKILLTASLCLFAGIFLLAQEESIKKIHIKVKKNDSITVDTSFAIDKDIDKDEIQKMIHEMTGMDVMIHHGDGFIMEGSGEKNIDFFVCIDEEKQDSLKKIREDEIVDVKKMKIEITIDDDGEGHAIIHKHGGGEHMKWIDSGSGKHFVIIEEEDGKKKRSEVIIDIHKNDKGNVFIRKKEIDDRKIIVLESSGKPIHFTTKDGKELEFIVKDNKTGTDIVIDKVSVIRIETTEDGDIKIVISDKKEKAVKKESKQKKK